MSVPESSRTEARPGTPTHLWIVAVLALLWNLLGAWSYLAAELELEGYMSQHSAEQVAYMTHLPSWVVSVWAIAVWCGVLGSIALLLRKAWATWLFGLSLIGLLGNTIYSFLLSNGPEIMGTVGLVLTAIIWAISIALLLYARAQARKGVLT